MKIAFISNKLTLRGTEIALYNYADYNEKYLNNESIIITRSYDYLFAQNSLFIHPDAYTKFNKRFKVIYYEHESDIERIIANEDIQATFIEKAGSWDNIMPRNCYNIIHCVFTTLQPHGNVYCA